MFVAVGASALIAAQEVPKPATLPILANVLDLRGNAIRDLSKSNFKISFDKKPITVLDARYTQGPRRIVVLLDMSGSMQGDADSTKWKIAKEAVEDLLQQTLLMYPSLFSLLQNRFTMYLAFPRVGHRFINGWRKGQLSPRT